jgi:hypothetical protein
MRAAAVALGSVVAACSSRGTALAPADAESAGIDAARWDARPLAALDAAIDGGPSPDAATATGFLRFQNGSADVLSTDIYVTAIGRSAPDTWSWLGPDGATHALDHTAADAADHLEKDGVRYANMSFTLADAPDVALPPEFVAGRVYISLGEPLYITIGADDQAWSAPDPRDVADPNAGIRYDWYELSYKHGALPCEGHTAQSAQFALALEATLRQTSSGYETTRGIAQASDDVLAAYEAAVPPEFLALLQLDTSGAPVRVLSPAAATPGALSSYFDPSIDDFWTTYALTPFTYVAADYSVTGAIGAAGQFEYTITTDEGAFPFTMTKPSTAEVFAGTGGFVGVEANAGFLAELNAAFNRGVATSTASWNDPSAFYPTGIASNPYAKFFHDLAIENLAFGFPMDGSNGQGSLQTLPNSDPLTELVITVRP